MILKDVVRGEDVPARYGGEEFAVLFPQTSIKEAETIAERIRDVLRKLSSLSSCNGEYRPRNVLHGSWNYPPAHFRRRPGSL